MWSVVSERHTRQTSHAKILWGSLGAVWCAAGAFESLPTQGNMQVNARLLGSSVCSRISTAGDMIMDINEEEAIFGPLLPDLKAQVRPAPVPEEGTDSKRRKNAAAAAAAIRQAQPPAAGTIWQALKRGSGTDRTAGQTSPEGGGCRIQVATGYHDDHAIQEPARSPRCHPAGTVPGGHGLENQTSEDSRSVGMPMRQSVFIGLLTELRARLTKLQELPESQKDWVVLTWDGDPNSDACGFRTVHHMGPTRGSSHQVLSNQTTGSRDVRRGDHLHLRTELAQHSSHTIASQTARMAGAHHF